MAEQQDYQVALVQEAPGKLSVTFPKGLIVKVKPSVSLNALLEVVAAKGGVSAEVQGQEGLYPVDPERF